MTVAVITINPVVTCMHSVCRLDRDGVPGFDRFNVGAWRIELVAYKRDITVQTLSHH